jgi:hypothetical protein
VRQLVVFQSRPSPVYPAGRVGTPADPNIPRGGSRVGKVGGVGIGLYAVLTRLFVA